MQGSLWVEVLSQPSPPQAPWSAQSQPYWPRGSCHETLAFNLPNQVRACTYNPRLPLALILTHTYTHSRTQRSQNFRASIFSIECNRLPPTTGTKQSSTGITRNAQKPQPKKTGHQRHIWLITPTIAITAVITSTTSTTTTILIAVTTRCNGFCNVLPLVWTRASSFGKRWPEIYLMKRTMMVCECGQMGLLVDSDCFI